MFMSNTRNVRFKTQVVADNCKREDSEYWLEQAPTDITFRLKLVAEYSGDQLNESVLIKHGFKGGRSLQTPSYKNENLMDYIKSIFKSKREKLTGVCWILPFVSYSIALILSLHSFRIPVSSSTVVALSMAILV